MLAPLPPRPDRHQSLEDPQQASIRDREYARRVLLPAPTFEKWELVRVEELSAARLDESARVPTVNQSKQGNQPTPTADPLVHSVRIERCIFGEPCIETSNRIAPLVNLACAAVRSRG